MQQELRASEEKYRSLFTSIDAGFCVVEMLWDEHGQLTDYRFIEVYPAFEGQTGLRDVVGQTIRGMHPDFEQVWVDRYGQVAKTGQAGLRGIALTGYGMEDDLRRTREVGFVEHLVKPVDFAQMRRAIERAIVLA